MFAVQWQCQECGWLAHEVRIPLGRELWATDHMVLGVGAKLLLFDARMLDDGTLAGKRERE